MKVCIVGCGAIGSLFAAHLARLDDVEVWAYELDQRHVDAINANGLRLSGVTDLWSHPQARSNVADIPPCEFGIIATKTLHTRPAIEATKDIFTDGAVCSVQNGVGAEEIIAEYVPRVIRGTTFPAGHVIEPGHIGQDTGGKTTIGPFEPKPATMDEVTQLAEALTRGGMETVGMDDARGRAMDQSDFQRGDQSYRCTDRFAAWRRLRSAKTARAHIPPCRGSRGCFERTGDNAGQRSGETDRSRT